MSDSIEILVVEDNPGDVALLKEGLSHEMLKFDLHVAKTGEKALEFIFNCGVPGKKSMPDLVLLDLSLPGKDGFEVLRQIKGTSSTRCVPVIIFTSSKAQDSVKKSYDLYANSYIQKPSNMNQIYKVAHYIKQYWFEVSSIPGKRLSN